MATDRVQRYAEGAMAVKWAILLDLFFLISKENRSVCRYGDRPRTRVRRGSYGGEMGDFTRNQRPVQNKWSLTSTALQGAASSPESFKG